MDVPDFNLGWDPRPLALAVVFGVAAIAFERWWFKDAHIKLDTNPDPRYLKKALRLVEAKALAEIETLRYETFNDNNSDPEVPNKGVVDCGSPGCVRCTVYAAQSEAALLRLAELLPVPSTRVVAGVQNGPSHPKEIYDGEPSSKSKGKGGLGKEKNGKKKGRLLKKTKKTKKTMTTEEKQDENEAEDEESGNSVSNPAQQPTVLRVPGLTCAAWVTHMHANTAVVALERKGPASVRVPSTSLQEVMLEEWQQLQKAQQMQQHDGGVGNNDAANNNDIWLRNDVKGRWDVLHFYNQGVKNDTAFKFCPKTAAIVDALPGLMKECAFGNAYLSVLQPGTVIEPHCGPTNVRHRLHFALSVPPDARSALTVDGESKGWTVGKCMVFDDSLYHSARHPNFVVEEQSCQSSSSSSSSGKAVKDEVVLKQARVVLICDLWHPELTNSERTAISHIYPPPSHD